MDDPHPKSTRIAEDNAAVKLAKVFEANLTNGRVFAHLS